ncbi:hypothetical protein E3E31_11990 [Thermococcus sp. M39]|uniref:UvrD-helicase domain-containing protein n=2 Tax=unclassified Thermococcus TaxID=2627626 RepID=UPI0014399CB1|nr:UvrD-helicase domain-containing protein [Thermococcus sp. M39]NJE09228.1 hypothetical protein [Thermococcus sp. M39]
MTPSPLKILIYGPPGAGKTRTLHNLIRWLTADTYDIETNEDLRDKIEKELLEAGFTKEFLDSLYGKYNYSNIIYVTFSNAMLEEFLVRRLNRDLELDRGKDSYFRYFRTVHGLSLVLHNDLKRTKAQRRREPPEVSFAKFCNKEGLQFSLDITSGYLYSKNEGNLLWTKISSTINKKYHELGQTAEERRKNLDKVMMEELDWLYDYWRKWEEYKREHGITDYNDMLMNFYDLLADEKPNLTEIKLTIGKGKEAYEVEYNLKVLIVDEAQDLSPLQYMIIKKISEQMELTVLAGDDAQTIYTFLGGQANLIFDFEKDADLVLKLRKTHRNPSKIMKFALFFRKFYMTERKYFKTTTTNPIEGEIFIVEDFRTKGDKIAVQQNYDILARLVEQELKAGNSVFVLARTNQQSFRIAIELLKRGFTPRLLKRNNKFENSVMGIYDYYDIAKAVALALEGRINKERFYKVALADFTGKLDVLYEQEFRRRYDEEEIAYLEETVMYEIKFNRVKSEMLLDIIRNPMLIENLIITFTIEDLKEAAERAKEIWGYYAKKALLELIESYEKNERLYYAKHTDGKLYVDTMHSAKGLEADTVFILNELPKKVYKEAITNEGESEAKVLFVALTRARKKLVILNGIRTFERLDDAIRKAMKTNLGIKRTYSVQLIKTNSPLKQNTTAQKQKSSSF